MFIERFLTARENPQILGEKFLGRENPQILELCSTAFMS